MRLNLIKSHIIKKIVYWYDKLKKLQGITKNNYNTWNENKNLIETNNNNKLKIDTILPLGIQRRRILSRGDFSVH